AEMLTPASLMAAASVARAPGLFSTSISRSVSISGSACTPKANHAGRACARAQAAQRGQGWASSPRWSYSHYAEPAFGDEVSPRQKAVLGDHGWASRARQRLCL